MSFSCFLDPYDFDFIESQQKPKKKQDVIEEKIKEHNIPTKKSKLSSFKQASMIDIEPSRIKPPSKKKKNITLDV